MRGLRAFAPGSHVVFGEATAILAGDGVCDALMATRGGKTPQRDLLGVRCRAAVIANVARAVSDRLR